MPSGKELTGGNRNVNDVGDLVAAVREITGELTTLSGALSTARSAVSTAFSATIGYSANAIFRSAQRFSRDTFINAISDQVRLGGSFEDNLTASAARSATRLPVLGALFSDAIGPTETAGQRTLGITGQIARAGGEVTPELRKAIFKRFRGEEERAQAEELSVNQLVNRALAGKEGGKDKILEVLVKINDGMERIFNWMTNFGQ